MVRKYNKTKIEVKQMKKCFLFILCLLLISSISAPVYGASGYVSRVSGNYVYTTSAKNDIEIWKHLYDTNVKHTAGTTTTIHISTSKTTSQSANASISAGGTFFITLATEIGFSQSQSYTTMAGHSFTIHPSTPTSWWRVVHVYPTTIATQTKIDISYDFEIVFNQTVRYAPDINMAYHQIYRYQ